MFYYISDYYDKAVFLTAAKMGEVVNVSESTVVRFAACLGYKGYPEFQKALEEMVLNKLNSVQRMEVTYGRISKTHVLSSVLQSDIYDAYGKTGTAEFSSDKGEAHSWFVGYATNGTKKLAIAVIIEEGGRSSSLSMPVVKDIFDYYFAD